MISHESRRRAGWWILGIMGTVGITSTTIGMFQTCVDDQTCQEWTSLAIWSGVAITTAGALLGLPMIMTSDEATLTLVPGTAPLANPASVRPRSRASVRGSRRRDVRRPFLTVDRPDDTQRFGDFADSELEDREELGRERYAADRAELVVFAATIHERRGDAQAEMVKLGELVPGAKVAGEFVAVLAVDDVGQVLAGANAELAEGRRIEPRHEVRRDARREVVGAAGRTP